MKLERIITPEIFLGRRGHPKIVEFYQRAIEDIHLEEIDGKSAIKVPLRQPYDMMDRNTLEFFILAGLYKRRKGKTYYVPKDFAQALSKVDRNIPIQYLPDDFIGYIQFAKGALSDDTGEVEGGFVYVGRSREVGFVSPDGVLHPDRKVIILTYSNSSQDPSTGVDTVTRFAHEAEEKKLSDYRDDYESKDYDRNGRRIEVPEDDLYKREPIYRAIINAVIYIHSQDPELLSLAPMGNKTSAQRRALREANRGAENYCTLPITVLNLSYHKGKSYSVDSTIVDTHMRWQRCGPGFSQVKLVWVREHERKYKNEREIQAAPEP